MEHSPTTESEPEWLSKEMLAEPSPDGSLANTGMPSVGSTAKPVGQGDSRIEFEKGMPLAPALTLALIAVNSLVFLVMLSRGALQSREAIIAAGALTQERVFAGEAWRLLSATFLHGGFDHLIGNCIVLFILGMACEHAYGAANTAVLYLSAALGGSALSVLLSPGPSVGASGAVFGLMGAAIVFFRKHQDRFTLRDNRVATVLMGWAGYSIVTAFFTPYIDNSAHIGGLVTGALLGYGLKPAAVRHAERITYYRAGE